MTTESQIQAPKTNFSEPPQFKKQNTFIKFPSFKETPLHKIHNLNLLSRKYQYKRYNNNRVFIFTKNRLLHMVKNNTN